VGLATLLLSDRAFFALVTEAAKRYTDYELTLDHPTLAWREGRLDIGLLQVHQSGSSGTPLLAIESLSVNATSHRALLEQGIAATDISADSVLLYVDSTDESADPDPASWLQYTRLLPHKLVVRSAHVVTRGARINVLPFSNLYGSWQDSTHFVASAGAYRPEDPFILAFSMERELRETGGQRLSLHGVLKPQTGSSSIELRGDIRASESDLDYRFDMHAEYEQVEDFLAVLDDSFYPFAGTLTLDGTLEGDLDAYQLAIRSLALDNGEAYQFSASGEVRREEATPARLDISARGRLGSLARLADISDTNAALLGEVSAQLQLTGALADPELSDFRVSTRSAGGLELLLQPASGRFTLAQRDLQASQQIALKASAPGLAALQGATGPLPLEPGAWSLEALISAEDGAYRASDIRIDLHEESLLGGQVRGAIGRLAPPAENGSGPVVEGIDLSLALASDAPGSLLDAFLPDLRELPAWDRATLQGRASGSLQSLTFSGASAAVIGPDFELKLKEATASVDLGDSVELRRAHGTVFLDTTPGTLQAFVSLPEAARQVSALQLTTQARYSPAGLALDDLRLSAQALRGELQLRGSVGNALTGDGLALQASVNTLPVAELAALSPDPSVSALLRRVPGTLSGSTQVTGTLEGLSAEDLHLSLLGSDAVGASLRGHGDWRNGSASAQLEVDYQVDDRSLIETLVGLPLATGTGTLVIDHQSSHTVLALHSLMGDSDISTVLNARRSEGEITAVDIDLNIPRLYLPDLLAAPTGAAADVDGSVSSGDDGETAAFAWRESLPVYPVTVRANIEEILGDSSALEGFAFTLSGAERRYLLENLDVNYAGGQAVFRGAADFSRETLGISLGGMAESLPVTTVAADLGYAGDIEGELSVLVGLSLEGSTPEALWQSLTGRTAVAITDGHIEGAAYDLLATDLLGWLLSGGILRDETDFRCAALSLNFRQGVGTSDRLYVLTRNMIAQGNATIDLPAGTMDVRVQPRARARTVQMPSAITVTGPLSGPRVRVSPIAATMDTSAKLLFLIPDTLLRLFGLGPDKDAGVQECRI
jgi:hypothetical protein